MRKLRRPAKPLLQNLLNLDNTVNINANPENEACHKGEKLQEKRTSLTF